MAQFYMTIQSRNSINAWHLCRAKTLAGAKLEASKKMDWGYIGDSIVVAEDNGIQRRWVAVKKNDRWQDAD